MVLKFILSQTIDNELVKFVLPVTPQSFEINTGNNNTTVQVEKIGEISLLGTPKLTTISISSFFPSQMYYFCEEKYFYEPYVCVELIKSFMENGPVKLNITGTDILKQFTIESFVYGENDGTGDVNYTLEFKEYKKASIKVASSKSSKKTKSITRPREGIKRVIPKTYKVKEGDSLYSIANKMYGDASRYKELVQKNNIKNYRALKVGKVLKVW